MSALKNLIGLRFGKWTVTERAENKGRLIAWLCRCDCGTEKTVVGQNLTSGRSKSCCGQGSTSMRHGHAATKTSPRSPTYYSWRAMVKRCENKREISFKYCGSRGIRVCERWRHGDGKSSGFECFYADMGPRPFGLSLDRADNDKGYSPDNCRWTTRIGQNRNQRRRQPAKLAAPPMETPISALDTSAVETVQ